MICDSLFVVVGHGLKDLGNKECFLIAVPKMEIKDIVHSIVSGFESRWISSKAI